MAIIWIAIILALIAIAISLAINIANEGTQNLDLRINTPASVTDNVQKTITVTILATAS